MMETLDILIGFYAGVAVTLSIALFSGYVERYYELPGGRDFIVITLVSLFWPATLTIRAVRVAWLSVKR